MHNKRIGIITITNGCNYGNRLQNLAMQLLLSESFEYVETINNNLCNTKLDIIKSRIKYIIKSILKKNKKSLDIDVFNKFNDNYINKSKYTLYRNTNNKRLDKYFDAYVIGSDQIWNPNYKENDSNVYAYFSSKAKIALAPSIGCKDISKDKQEEMIKYINNLDYCSLREEYSANQFSNLCNKKIDYLIDPTLMIDANTWLKYESKVDLPKEYILLYFLGNISDEVNQYIKNLNLDSNVKIINLSEYRKEHTVGPGEFIYFIRNAKLIITDSYHGSIFSYIFNKSLRITKRDGKESSMYIRMESLINTLSLNDYVFNKDEIISIDDIRPCRYNEVVINQFKDIYKKQIKELANKLN